MTTLSYTIMSIPPAFGGSCTLAWLKMAPVPAPKHLGSRREVLVTYTERPPMRSGPGVGYCLPLKVHNDYSVRVLPTDTKPELLENSTFLLYNLLFNNLDPTVEAHISVSLSDIEDSETR